ncbi:MAG TPA: DNA polymerase III subunit gamma/tau [Candidatus Paceibacterota bacterium]|nr:DNA polymerase III subunit gamma/tau [Verrucomicrobiota bacterium]HSA10017.1 DNA polymerase III subunit gamma/tau [Candidatus Paceibacterota bacterium]
MSYQVIARKYRPQRFQDVVGQEHVTQTLAHAIEQKRIAHAYLFCGPRGTGKTTIARIFAKCLNCEGGPKVDFDDKDARCQEIAEGRSLDVFEIDGASNNGVEQVRELRETCKYAPASSRFKIYIIDEVHMLSTAAFNALLKTLEEPPAHVKFMFATTDPEKVLPTILSRCQRFDLRRIPAALIAKHLTHIAGLEEVKIDPAALYAIARGAEGAMRDAESALDQLISFCGDKIEESDVLSMFGLTAQGQLLELSRAVLAGEVETALRQLNDLANHGKDLGRLLSDLLNHFRNLLIFQVSRGDLKMLEVSEAEAGSLKEQSAMASAEGLTRIMEVLAEAEAGMRDAISKKILIEVALLKSIEARSAVSIDSLLKQLQNLRGGGAGDAAGTTSPPATGSSKPLRAVAPSSSLSTPAAASQPSADAPPPPAGDLEELWAGLVESVGRVSPFTRSYLLEAHPVSFQQNVFTIGFDPEFEDRLGLVDNARNHELLRTKLLELGHPSVQIKFIKAEAPTLAAGRTAPPAPAPAAGPAPKASAAARTAAAPAKAKLASVPFSKDDFKDDPLIQKALEKFKGQIVDVRA